MGDYFNKDTFKIFGKIVSGFTHELNNIISIVYELNGNIEDKLNSIGTVEKEILDKISKSINKVYNQIERSKLLTKSLNLITHLADSDIQNIDIIELINNVIELLQYFAKLSNSRIIKDLGVSHKYYSTNPFLLSILLFDCLLMVIRLLGFNREINVLLTADETATICISFQGNESISEEFELFKKRYFEIASSFSIGIEAKIESSNLNSNISIIINPIKGEI